MSVIPPVTERRVVCGITSAARSMDVSYQYLWQVLSGKLSSPALVLKILRLCPSLLSSPRCKIPWRQIADEAAPLYRWDESAQRYRKTTRRRRSETKR